MMFAFSILYTYKYLTMERMFTLNGLRWLFPFTAKVLSGVLFFLLLFSALPGTAQTVTTDLPDYYPGDIVKISGEGWEPEEQVTLLITWETMTEGSFETIVTADEFGNISNEEFIIQPEHLGENFILKATSQDGETVVFAYFTDQPRLGNIDPIIQLNSICAGQGGTVIIEYTVNRGTNTTGNVTVDISLTSVLPAGVTVASGLPLTGISIPGSGYTNQFTLNIPVSLAAGSYPIDLIADALGNDEAIGSGNLVISTGTLQLTGTLPGGALGNSCFDEAPTAPAGSLIASQYSANCGGTITAALTNSSVDGDDCSWTATYEYTVSNSAGSVTATVIYTGGDTEDPEGDAPDAITGIDACKPNQADSESAFDAAYAASGYSDNCGTVTANLKNTVVDGNNCSWTITYTFDVEDDCDNLLEAQTYTRSGGNDADPTGTEPDPITGVGECLPTQQEANDAFDALYAADGYSDACGGKVTAELVSADIEGTNCLWTVTYTFKVGDGCDNELTGQTYTRSGGDETPPALTGVIPTGQTNMNLCFNAIPAGPSEGDIAALFTDACGGIINVVKSGTPIGDDCSWSVTYSYTVEDACQNPYGSPVTVSYSGSDKTPPTLSGVLPSGQTGMNLCYNAVPAGPTIEEIAAQFTDGCGGAITVVKSGTPTGNDCGWSVTYSYTVRDKCNNFIALPVEITYSGSDQTPPALTGTIPSGQTGMNLCFSAVPAGPSEAEIAAKFTDGCGGAITVEKSGTPIGTDCNWSVTYTYTVRDKCMNFISTPVQIIYSGSDQTKPTVITKDIEISLGPGGTASILPADVNNGSSDNCDKPVTLVSVSPNSFDCDDVGSPVQVTLTVRDECGNEQTGTAMVTVKKNAAVVTYIGDNTAQYSDIATLKAQVYGSDGVTPIAGVTVKFSIGTQNTTAITNALGIAETTMKIELDPDPGQPFRDLATGGAAYTVKAEIDPGECYEGSDSKDFDVTRENADVLYTGQTFITTASTKATSCNVVLSATIRDITAVLPCSPPCDVDGGDIRKAKVKFYIVETNQWIDANVGLVNPGDLLVGTATATVNLSAGSTGGATYTVFVKVGDYYMGKTEAITITVATPGGEKVTGGGYLILTNKSGGTYAGDEGSRNNFGFNIMYNKRNTNLQGHINTIIRRTVTKGPGVVWDDDCNGTDDYPEGHTMVRNYQVKGNAMTSLSVVKPVTVSPTTPATATYFGKANMADVTGDCPISLGGNLTLRVDVTDKGEPGKADEIAIIVWNGGGGVMYVANWNGTNSAQQVLDGGNIVVHGGSVAAKASQSIEPEALITQLDVRVMGNPSTGYTPFRVQVVSDNSTDAINLRVMDAAGRPMESFQRLQSGTMLDVGRGYTKGMYFLEAQQGDQRKVIKLLKQ